MSVHRVRPVLGVAIALLLLAAACGGGDDGTEASGGGDGGDGGSSEEGSGGGGDGPQEIELTHEVIADLDAIFLKSPVAVDGAVLALRGALDADGLVRVELDGTVTEVVAWAVPDPASPQPGTRNSYLFTTSAGVFVATSDGQSCGYAPIDPSSGELGEAITLPGEDQCTSTPRPIPVEGSVVATTPRDGQVHLVDTADGSVESFTADVPGDYGQGLLVTDEAFFVDGSVPWDGEGDPPPSTVVRIDRETLEETARAELDSLPSLYGTTLVTGEWTDANGDDEAQPEERRFQRIDPDTLAVEPIDFEEIANCPAGDLALSPTDGGTWRLRRDDSSEPFNVLLVDPESCGVHDEVQLPDIEGAPDGSIAGGLPVVVDGDLYLIRMALAADGSASHATSLERVTVA